MADWKGSLFRRRLRSAERFKERAMLRGSSRENTPGSRSSALLVWVTRRDQRLTFCLVTLFEFLVAWRSGKRETGMPVSRKPLCSFRSNCSCSGFFRDFGGQSQQSIPEFRVNLIQVDFLRQMNRAKHRAGLKFTVMDHTFLVGVLVIVSLVDVLLVGGMIVERVK